MSSEVVVVGVRNTTMVGGLLDGLDWTSLLPSDQHHLCTEWQPLNHLYYQVPVLPTYWSGLSRLFSHCAFCFVFMAEGSYPTSMR